MNYSQYHSVCVSTSVYVCMQALIHLFMHAISCVYYTEVLFNGSNFAVSINIQQEPRGACCRNRLTRKVEDAFERDYNCTLPQSFIPQ